MTDERFFYQLTKGLLLFIAGLFFLRLFPALWGALGVGVIVLVLVTLFYTFYRQRSRRKNKETFAGNFGLQIKARITASRQRADQFRNEAAEILQSHRELVDQLDKTSDATPSARQKGERLLKELHEEQALRLSKATFFEASVAQLERLLQQHHLHETLLAKEAQLDQLRSANYDDIAEMEKIRYQLEQDRTRLETITDLTHRAAVSPTLNQTELLRVELGKVG